MIILNSIIFLLLQTIFLGFLHEPYIVPLRMYVFTLIALTPYVSWISIVLCLDVVWWICLGLMTISHGVTFAITLLLWRVLLSYIKWTPFAFGCMIWMFTLLSITPVIQWTVRKIIATIIIAALVAWYLTRYGRQSREL